MNKKSILKEKIVRSIFLYETKKITFETIAKFSILLISILILIIFGGVIVDIYTENELGDILGNVLMSGEQSMMKIRDTYFVFSSEIPLWVVAIYILGFLLGCILIISIIKNWDTLSHKMRSLTRYWLKQ